MVTERQGHRSGEVLDRTDLLEDLLEAGLRRKLLATFLLALVDPGLPVVVAQQPVKRLGLQG
jgi:hypothetical protein